MLQRLPVLVPSDGVGAGKYTDISGDGFGGMFDNNVSVNGWGDSPYGTGNGDGIGANYGTSDGDGVGGG